MGNSPMSCSFLGCVEQWSSIAISSLGRGRTSSGARANFFSADSSCRTFTYAAITCSELYEAMARLPCATAVALCWSSDFFDHSRNSPASCSPAVPAAMARGSEGSGGARWLPANSLLAYRFCAERPSLWARRLRCVPCSARSGGEGSEPPQGSHAHWPPASSSRPP